MKLNSPADCMEPTGEGGEGPEVASGPEHTSPWQMGQGLGSPRGCVCLGH